MSHATLSEIDHFGDKPYVFVSEDPDTFRTYYRKGSRLYCFMRDDHKKGNAIEFFECTAQGEPLCVVRAPLQEEFDKLILPSIETLKGH